MTADGRIDASPRLARVALAPEGPVPTVAWEAIRKGTEDYRLVQYFCDLFDSVDRVCRDKLGKVQKTLSKEECAQIRKREEQSYEKQPPESPVVQWTAKTNLQKLAEKEMLEVLELERVLYAARMAKTLLVDAIPFSLAYSMRIPDDDWRNHFDPEIGETEKVIGAETKRAALLPHALRLQEMVRRYHGTLRK